MLNEIFTNTSPGADLRSKASLLVNIIWTLLIILTLSFVTAMFIHTEYTYRYCLIIVLVWSMSIAILMLTKKGYARLGAFLYISFLVLMILGFSWTGGGIRGHGIKILPIVVLFAGLTLGKREIWLFGIVATLGGLVFVLADYFHLIPIKEALGQSPLLYWIYTTTAIFMLCHLENLSVEELRKALYTCQKELMMREQSEELLKIKNEKLMEIAFLQSHIVRRPVANVLGLIGLIKSDNPNNSSDIDLILKLEIAAKELDDVIREIVRNTSEIESMTQNKTE
jgi:hypothetical protein